MPLPSATPLDTFELPAGFDAVGLSCGLKPSGKLDLALLTGGSPWTAAGLFTTNHVVAAPVVWDREVLAKSAGSIRALVANSGCANACTGERGMADVRTTAEAVAAAVGCAPGEVLVLSTGVIGLPLDTGRLTRGIAEAAKQLGGSVGSPALGASTAPEVVSERRATPRARRAKASRPGDAASGESRHGAAVRAIMTTDTVHKTASGEAALAGGTVQIRGFAKGAGMIHPNMATMLAVIATDAALEPARAQALLAEANQRSFNCVSVDGDMSTNDTVLLLASGASSVKVAKKDEPAFLAALTGVCVSLARQIACDGEGATRMIEVTVTGAASEAKAHHIADAIARSALFKTAVHGGDPNWGRVLAAAGSCGEAFDETRVSLWFGEGSPAVRVVERGVRATYGEAAAAARLRENPVMVRLDLGEGKSAATVWTCDLSAAYVSINADYTT